MGQKRTKHIQPATADPFKRLQELLLKDEDVLHYEIQKEVEVLREKLEDPAEIEKRIRPYLEKNIEYLQANFPEMFGGIITDTISLQIKNSQDKMVDALYPIIGKLISKYIVKEFEALAEKIDRQVKAALSPKNWKARIKGWFTGVKMEDQIKSELLDAKIEEAFILEIDSGMILASHTSEDVVDDDMVAGMLTAIRAWGQDSFHNKLENLEQIEFGTRKVLLQNFHTYFVALVVSGLLSADYKNALREHLNDFAIKNAPSRQSDLTEKYQKDLSDKLSNSLNEFINKSK